MDPAPVRRGGCQIPSDREDSTRPQRERRYQESLQRAQRDFFEFSEAWRARRLDARVPELLMRALAQFAVDTSTQRMYGQDYVAEVRLLLDFPAPPSAPVGVVGQPGAAGSDVRP